MDGSRCRRLRIHVHYKLQEVMVRRCICSQKQKCWKSLWGSQRRRTAAILARTLLNKLHVFEIKFDLTKIHSCIIFIINRFRPCSHGALSVSEHAHWGWGGFGILLVLTIGIWFECKRLKLIINMKSVYCEKSALDLPLGSYRLGFDMCVWGG